MTYLLEQVREFAAADNGNGRLKKERAALARAADNVEGIVTAMNGFLGASLEQAPQIYRVGLNTTRLLLALGDLVVGWLLGRQAEVALAKLDQGGLSASDTAFYQGKVASRRLLRRDRAAAPGRRAGDRRGDVARPDGATRRSVLTHQTSVGRPQLPPAGGRAVTSLARRVRGRAWRSRARVMRGCATCEPRQGRSAAADQISY